ncbi:MAG TPA: hypothetical protein PLF51_03400, partial [Candidatus Hydrogenedentes bacterium]|nr:hypothetical protein [Candidatus Hydrogenedentota bacterium]
MFRRKQAREAGRCGACGGPARSEGSLLETKPGQGFGQGHGERCRARLGACQCRGDGGRGGGDPARSEERTQLRETALDAVADGPARDAHVAGDGPVRPAIQEMRHDGLAKLFREVLNGLVQ